MKKMFLGALAAVTLAAPGALLPSAAYAQDNHWQGDRQGWDPARSYRGGGNHGDRRLGRDDHVYRGHDGRYYCKRNDGTTGLVIGAIGGGVLGNVLGGGGALGTVLGAGGGALLGRSIDRGQVHCR
jgi:hypothetical protein